MPPFLTQGWLDAHTAAGAELPVRAGVTARLQMVVTGSPSGEVSYVQTIEDGRVVAGELGRSDEVDLTLTYPAAEAAAIAKGELDLSAAFMQGKAKLVGDVGSLMAVMPLVQSMEYREVLAAVAEQTEF